MSDVPVRASFDDAISGSPASIQEIAQRLRALIMAVYPDAVEVAWPKQRIVGYGVGQRKMSEHFCYIGLYRDHVNLGFYHGIELPDPEGLLEGTGQRLRHAKIQDAEQIELPAVRHLVEASLAERRAALGMDR